MADGVLTAQDILDLQLESNLVNLSSCWGGAYKFSIWNELHGFIRNLLISRTRNIIASFYPLGDNACFSFNKVFYSNFHKRTPQSAFQNAIVSISDKYSEYEWGGLYLTGKS